jgi:hypothetical protein
MLMNWLKTRIRRQLWRLKLLREEQRIELPKRGLGSFGFGQSILSITADIRPRTRAETLFAVYSETLERLEKWTTRG